LQYSYGECDTTDAGSGTESESREVGAGVGEYDAPVLPQPEWESTTPLFCHSRSGRVRHPCPAAAGVGEYDAPVLPQLEKMMLSMERLRRLRINNAIVRESLAELLGTLTLVFIGDSAIANYRGNPGVGQLGIAFGYASALAISVFATGGVSGGHLNPAVTLALCLTGRCDWNRLLPFSIAQYIGGFIGAAFTQGLFFDAFQDDDGRTNLFGVFATYPNGEISTGGAFLDQAMGTALLLYGIMAITDKRNMQVPKGVIPLAIGLTLFMVISCSGSNTGAALNPARDLGPRLYSLAIGYDDVFNAGNHFWWIPVVACYVGGPIGALVYFFCIELHHPDEDGAEKAAEASQHVQAAARASQHAQAPRGRGIENGAFEEERQSRSRPGRGEYGEEVQGRYRQDRRSDPRAGREEFDKATYGGDGYM